MKSPFEAKRVIVAACAAIAMVLGAMSVGASVSPTNDRPATKAEVSSIVDSRDSSSTSKSVSSTGLSRQHTLEVRNFLLQQTTPLYTTPPASKTSRNVLPPIFGSSNPVILMDQMVQLQQTQSGTSGTVSDSKATSSTTTPAPTEDTSGTPAAKTPAEDPGTTPADSGKPADGSTPDPSPSVMNMDAQPTPSN
jgi:hypothetical protein